MPKKLNIFTWRVLLGRLPTRWSLSLKGLNIPSLLCPLCLKMWKKLIMSCFCVNRLLLFGQWYLDGWIWSCQVSLVYENYLFGWKWSIFLLKSRRLWSQLFKRLNGWSEGSVTVLFLGSLSRPKSLFLMIVDFSFNCFLETIKQMLVGLIGL